MQPFLAKSNKKPYLLASLDDVTGDLRPSVVLRRLPLQLDGVPVQVGVDHGTHGRVRPVHHRNVQGAGVRAELVLHLDVVLAAVQAVGVVDVEDDVGVGDLAGEAVGDDGLAALAGPLGGGGGGAGVGNLDLNYKKSLSDLKVE